MDDFTRSRTNLHMVNHSHGAGPDRADTYNVGNLPCAVSSTASGSPNGPDLAGDKSSSEGPSATTFHSILFERAEDSDKTKTREQPDFFIDLNLDQIIEAITAGKKEYNLKPFYHTPLRDIESIKYRHEIMMELENKALFQHIESFSKEMRVMRQHLAQADELRYRRQKERWFLDAVIVYCDAVSRLGDGLSHVGLKSRGFLAFSKYLLDYIESDRFKSLLAETKKITADLLSVKYCLHIKDSTIQVRKYDSEIDYSTQVEGTFEKFKQGAVKDFRAKFSEWPDMNHVEAKVLDLVAQLYPDIFLYLEDYCERNVDYLDETIGDFDREIQFYIAYLEYIAKLKQAGLQFCYPEISDKDKEVYDYEGFDLALAQKLISANSSVVLNDFYLQGKERILVVSGPNQGGKTTFARAFGQLHYMANIGCPVPGREARLFLFDSLFTHFEKEESINNLRGKLQDDLVRIHDILSLATTNSVVLINEMFTSTTLQDAVALGKKIMEQIIDMDLLCVFVTFIDELSDLSDKTVSMVSTVVPENPASRTFKIVRRPADGLSYAISIAEKYRLTYESLKERIRS